MKYILYVLGIVFFSIKGVAQPTSTIFSDDIWFFGQNEGITTALPEGVKYTSKGILFKNKGGIITREDGSGQSMVNSYENSLSVSTPACNGSFVFYTQHNRVFNSEHKPMAGGINPTTNPGEFRGHSSVADGLAAAYLGDNKYILFSVSKPFETVPGDPKPFGFLYYYIIDMTKNNGLGEINAGILFSQVRVNEALEIVPKKDTENEYYVIYHSRGESPTPNMIRVIEFKYPGTDLNRIAVVDKGGVAIPENSSTDQLLYNIKANKDYTKLGLVFPRTGTTYVYNFNPATGAMTTPKTFKTGTVSDAYGLEYSPNGQFLYVGCHRLSSNVIQFNLNTGALLHTNPYTVTTLVQKGGAMKLGPDGKIYITRSGSKFMAIIDNPDLAFNAPGGGVTIEGYEMNRGNTGLGISVGLTPPWKDPDNNATVPQTNPDLITGNQYDTIRIKPLDNDIAINVGKIINLNGVQFVNDADKEKGNLTFNAAKQEVYFAPNPLYPFTDGEVINVRYIIKDNSIPISLCNDGEIKITIKPTKVGCTLFSDDIWFFGNNEGVPENNSTEKGTVFTSKGIIFKDVNGTITGVDYSGISRVNSWENSLSVSTPACNGSFIFYAGHDTLYNLNHEPMKSDIGKDGYFRGHTSNGDGLAAAYLGDNKYILTAVSDFRNNPGTKLFYYIVDMNQDGGYGRMIYKDSIDYTGTIISEAIEMIPVVGTYDKYWLIYLESVSKEIRCVLIDADNDPSRPKITKKGKISIADYFTITTNQYSNAIWRMHSSPDYTRLGLNIPINSNDKHLLFLTFNPATGELGFDRHIQSVVPATTSSYASFVFVGKYVFIAESRSSGKGYMVAKYNLDDDTYTTQTVNTVIPAPGFKGGGMKMGPDGKIYIMRQGEKYMAMIHNPTDPSPNFVIDDEGLELTSSGMGLSLSTGLTLPWIDPPGLTSNVPPVSVADVSATLIGIPVVVNPLDNDYDPAPTTALSLSAVSHVNEADKTKITLVKNGNSVTITPIAGQAAAGDIYNFEYTVKDLGTPIAMCSDNIIKILVLNTPNIVLLDSCSFGASLNLDRNLLNGYTAQWEYSANNTTWTPLTGETKGSLIIKETTKEGYYKLKISKGGKSIYTTSKKLSIEKYKIGKKIWYKSGIL